MMLTRSLTYEFDSPHMKYRRHFHPC